MMAKVPWKAMKRRWGMLPLASRPTPRRRAWPSPPIQGLPSAKARLYPKRAQMSPTKARAAKLIIMVFKAFLLRTNPP
jgi:hypothetical protein